MRRIAVAVLAVVVALGLSASVMADEAPAKAAKPGYVMGQLSKIDGKALTITATRHDKSVDTIVTCTDTTTYAQDGAAAGAPAVTFNDLKVGTKVKATFNKADKTALTVTILKADAAPAAK